MKKLIKENKYYKINETVVKTNLEMVQNAEDIKKDTVDFIPNFDDSTKEPTVLPAKFPFLLKFLVIF